MKPKTYIFFKKRDGKDVGRKAMSPSGFAQISKDVDLVLTVSRSEELYHMLVSALLEFAALPMKRVELCRYADYDERPGQK